MIQDIEPLEFRNEFYIKKPADNSLILNFYNGEIFTKIENETINFPTYKETKSLNGEYIYLFKVSDIDVFLFVSDEKCFLDGFSYEKIMVLRKPLKPKYMRFIGVSAYHLSEWYEGTKFCSKCGKKLKFSHDLRMLTCDNCKSEYFPKISPAVIVGVVSGDKILVTNYAGRKTNNYALVAGFCEFGETPEQTAKREVFEETGIKIKNLRYYKSQPWGFSQSLLMGFFAQIDGDEDIVMDQNELSLAEFKSRDELLVRPDDISLTNEMICKFIDEDF